MTTLRNIIFVFLACSAGGCAIQKIADDGPAITRPHKVPSRDVAVYTSASDVPGRYWVIEQVWVRDDGMAYPEELEKDLRVIAGARGANAVILDPTNRKANGTRVDLRVQFDNPFDYYSGTAVWIGDGPPPVTVIRQ